MPLYTFKVYEYIYTTVHEMDPGESSEKCHNILIKTMTEIKSWCSATIKAYSGF